MSYNIEYTVLCNKGKLRANNQDNFWCMGAFLPSTNDGLTESVAGTTNTKNLPAFAIFDGMGGEQQGEVAAYIAASNFDTFYMESPKNDIKQFMLDACAKANTEICAHADKEKLRSTGTTAAILMFGAKEIFICNVGDSRIYHFCDNKLFQISHDHTTTDTLDNIPALTQSLGIPETEYTITPYVAKGVYNKRDIYMLCSDGLTDMVTDSDIEKIIAKNPSITNSGEELLKKALDAGGHDNITIILCEIQRQKPDILSILRRRC